MNVKLFLKAVAEIAGGIADLVRWLVRTMK